MKPDDPAFVLEHSSIERDPHASRRLYRFGCGLLLATTVWFLAKTGGDVGIDILLGLGILILACMPALRWAARGNSWFPAFEISMLACAAFYALPLLSRHEELAPYPATVVNEAAWLVLLYLAAANFGFALLRNPVRAPAWALRSLLPEQAHRHIPVGLALNTLYLYVHSFTDVIPLKFDGTLRALFFGIGILCTFVLARLLGLQRLKRNVAVFFITNLALQVLFLFSQLYLISGISLVALAIIAYSVARRHFPWRFLLFFIPAIALLHLGKSEMRHHYWEEEKPAPGMIQLPGYFAEWVGYSFDALRADEADQQARSSIFSRASLIQMLCLSVDRVPSLKPFLGGESYVDIPAQVIPRFLWPGKPSSLLANIRLALYFNLVSEESAFSVSIAFGVISEAYVNFGYIGVIVLGLFLGMAYKRVAQLAQNAPQFSALGVLMILLTAWSFQAELVLATWLSSLFQASVVCIGLPLAYRQFTTR